MSLATPQATLKIVRKFGLRLEKSLGQHFLVDQNILNKVVAAGELSLADTVIEPGPGIGTLTQALAGRAGTVVAVDIDRRLKPILEYTLEGLSNAHVVFTDALSLDIANLPGGLPVPNKLVSNLPYQIATPLLATYLDKFPQIGLYVGMVQKEVADRILARPATPEYGAFSVKAQYYCDVSRVATVSKHVFMPPPEVASAIVKMRRFEIPRVKVTDKELFFRVVKAAFWQRRKTLRNALLGSPELSFAAPEVSKALEMAKIQPGRRGETLSIEEFAAVANFLAVHKTA